MSAKVIPLGCVTRLDLPPERVLQSAMEAGMRGVVILGYDKDDNEYFASTYADGGTVVWLLERCKKALLAAGDDET